MTNTDANTGDENEITDPVTPQLRALDAMEALSGVHALLCGNFSVLWVRIPIALV